MHNFIEYNDNYSKTSRSFWQYYTDETVEEDVTITNSKQFKPKVKITGKTVDGNTKNVEISVPL